MSKYRRRPDRAASRKPGKQATRMLKGIVAFMRKTGCPPTFREMDEFSGFGRAHYIARRLYAELMHKGFITRPLRRGSRNLALAGAELKLVFKDNEEGRRLALALGEDIGEWSS
jgi:hypothetical protein